MIREPEDLPYTLSQNIFGGKDGEVRSWLF